METAELIHQAVAGASEVLLMANPYPGSTVKALQALGFTQSENVLDFNDHEKHHQLAREYRHKYPQYKFITEYQFDKVRSKYKLKTGALSLFKGAIADKNVADMMNFAILPDDIDRGYRGDIGTGGMLANVVNDYYAEMMRSYGIPSYIQGGIVSRGVFSDGSSDRTDIAMDFTRPSFDSPLNNLSREINELREIQRRPDPRPRSYGPEDFTTQFERKAQKMYHHPAERDDKLSFTEIVRKHPSAMMITADPELFKSHNPWLDPIVTVTVHGGYLVVTAWGAEAADPDIRNEKLN